MMPETRAYLKSLAVVDQLMIYYRNKDTPPDKLIIQALDLKIDPNELKKYIEESENVGCDKEKCEETTGW